MKNSRRVVERTPMTQQEKRIKIAEACGQSDRWLIRKHGLYYRPHAKGYTHNIADAWIVTEAVADQHAYPHDEPVTKERAPLPDYYNDLNAMHEAEKMLDKAIHSGDSPRYAYSRILYNLVELNQQPFRAAAAQRAEAFGLTLGLWKEGE